ncbi:MAG TPA: histidine kinase dimerization/phospho-acceptor domain-containing protein, partial [Chitinophagaceae bacterium]|nr:histidine kinase dimerization/phospho-acceptor domain-containing protein [Chitinophagaceae bacterium]
MKFTLAYTLLFLYVIAAIVFWGYSLNKQNRQLFNLEKEKLELMRKQMPETEYQANYQKILQNKIRRNKQYWGEGSTFILIILLTAGIVYYAYYRQRALARLQQNFMLSVTHELKSPLAGIKLNLQTLEKRKLEEAIQQKLFQHTLTETDRLNDLCNNILVSTQLESKHQALYNEQIVLRDLIETLLTQLQSRYPNYTFQLDPEFPDFELEADRSLWQLLISNLLENARK